MSRTLNLLCDLANDVLVELAVGITSLQVVTERRVSVLQLAFDCGTRKPSLSLLFCVLTFSSVFSGFMWIFVAVL